MSDHPLGRLVGWILLAFAGLAIAVALSVAASNLSTQPIGLEGEPLRAGDRLAPPNVTRTQATVSPTRKQKAAGKHKVQALTTPTQTQTAPQTTTGTSPNDPDADRGRHDGDDD